MDCLIIGYGSIGERHASILSRLGHDIHVVSRRDIKGLPSYKSIKEALQSKNFDYIIISNETSNHYKSFMKLNEFGYSGKLLIEKPIFLVPGPVSQSEFENVFVGYNLRFHPLVQKLYEFLNGKEIYSIQVYVGQYLPSWRPGTDYRRCYSAFREQGGGVLRDLSHELDYLNWITGGWKKVAARGGKFSDLQINSDDVFALLLEMENCPVACVQMNYLDRNARREIIVNLKEHTIKADLIQGILEIDGKISRYKVDRNLTYTEQHNAILSGDYRTACTYNQGLDVLNLIQAAELASNKQEWVNGSNLGKKS